MSTTVGGGNPHRPAEARRSTERRPRPAPPSATLLRGHDGNPLDLTPVFVKWDTSAKGDLTRQAQKSLQTCAIAGKGTMMKLHGCQTSKFHKNLNPHVEVLRQGRIEHYKKILLGQIELAADSKGNRTTELKAIVQQVVAGRAINIPTHVGYKPEYKTAEGELVVRPFETKLLESLPIRFALPVFRLTQDDIPEDASQLLDKWLGQQQLYKSLL
ncbi:hypothetical protein VTK56DRAFT_6749 [Thermocarpiscus australiensis]